MWNTCNQIGFLSLMPHYINKDWKLCKQIISFRIVESPHVGFILENTILEVLQEWEIFINKVLL